MHKLIRFVVKAINASEAKEEAERILNDMIESNVGFIDYGSFYEKGASGHSVGGWGYDKEAYNIKEREARELLVTGFRYDFEEFLIAVKEAKKLLEQDPVKLFNNTMDTYKISKVNNREFVVYEGEFVNGNLFNSYTDKEFMKHLWVVPCDVHY